MVYDATQRGPTFICAAPEKMGTTWLFRNLQRHPDVFLAPIKEMDYFIEAQRWPNSRWPSRFFGQRDYFQKRYFKYLIRRPGHYLIKYPKHLLEPWRLAWDWKFIFGTHDDEWYLSAFDIPGRFSVKGEISPPYFHIPDAAIAHMKRLLPNVKVILGLRSPIDWRWSFARMALLRNRNRKLEDVQTGELEKFIFGSLGELSFSESIKRWQKHFPPEQLYIYFFDRLVEQPPEVFTELCDFLGVDLGRMPKEALTNVDRRINEGVNVPLPPKLGMDLARHCRADIEELCRMYTGYPQSWLEQCEHYLAAA